MVITVSLGPLEFDFSTLNITSMGKILQVWPSLVLGAPLHWQCGQTPANHTGWPPGKLLPNLKTVCLWVNEPTAEALPCVCPRKTMYRECSLHHSWGPILNENAREPELADSTTWNSKTMKTTQTPSKEGDWLNNYSTSTLWTIVQQLKAMG